MSESEARQILDVAQAAGEEAIRAAYLRKVAEFPPERDPEQFEKIRDAYAVLRDRRTRAQSILYDANPLPRLETLVDQVSDKRDFVGPKAWREVLKNR
jgi:DnaJ-class molecular chaperone